MSLARARSSSPSLHSDVSGSGSCVSPRSAKRRAAPGLQVPQSLLVDFLTGGYSYDDASVTAALDRGNDHFARREPQQALDFFAAAYEIGRLHCVYPPLMHDLLLRRVLCHSMLGDIRTAMSEAELALLVIPNSASAKIVKGVLLSKLARADDASACFHQAVALCEELRDVADCVVALCTLAQGHADRAIQVSTQVLERSPGDLFALIVRGDAYKFHPSGFYARQASDDYSAVLARDPSLESLMGDRPDALLKSGHVRLDELLLRFHPWLRAEAPRSYVAYPMFHQKRFLHYASLVTFGIAKFRTLVRSSQLVRSVWEEHEDLLRQRASAERRMQQLLEAQRKVAAVESHSEVWGPADPDNLSNRKYRRYWMERPLDFPLRGRQPSPSCSISEHSRSLRERSVTPPKLSVEAQLAVDSLCRRSSSGDFDTVPVPTVQSPPQRPVLSDNQATAKARPFIMSHTPSSAAVSAAACSHSEGRAFEAMPSGHSHPATGGPNNPNSQRANVPAPPLSGMVHTTNRPPAAHDLESNTSVDLGRHAFAPPNAAARPPVQGSSPRLGAATEQRPTTKGTVESAAHEAHSCSPRSAHDLATASVYPEGTQISKIGHKWDEKQWIAKALELADAFSGQEPKGARVNLLDDPIDPLSWLNSRRSPTMSSALTRPTASAEDAAANTVAVVEAVEQHGFKEIPAWYRAVDEIYEVTDMVASTATPEPFVPARGLAGAPGHSYVVPPKSPQRQRGRPTRGLTRPRPQEGTAEANVQSHPEPTGDDSAYAVDGSLDDSTVRRYQHRLLASALPGASPIPVAGVAADEA